ncbi:MAG: hypothetical protein ACRYFU_11295 [Janthinobacterium lividum]
MKVFAAVLLATATLAQVPVVRAETLTGTQVNGNLWVDGNTGQNAFDQSSATINSLVEFTGESYGGSAGYCEYLANFSAAKVAITDICTPTATAAAAATSPASSVSHDNFEMTFTDSALLGDAVSPIDNGLGLSAALSGDTLTLTLTDGYATSNSSAFAITTAVTPEPASWQLLLLGCSGMLSIAYVAKLKSSREAEA